MACRYGSLLLLFFIVSVGAVLSQAPPGPARDFWNIDCGGTETFVKANKLTFEGDAPYIRTGVSRTAPDAERNGIPREIATLRAFPPTPWKKNCYRVPVEQGTKVLVRVTSYYGNYDGLNSAPAFDVRFDTAEWCSVTTDLDLKSWIYCEVVYLTTKMLGTDICFVRTNDDQSPIVSSIEVRRLPSDMYGLLDFSSKALFMRRRFAFGANKTIGYPDDAYNRDWSPNDLQGNDGGPSNSKAVIVKRESMTAVNTSRLIDAPPPLLFQAAAVAPMVDNRTAGNLTIPMPWLTSEQLNIYFTMYYTEVASAAGISSQRQNRTFLLFRDGKPLNSTLLLQAEIGVAHELYGSFGKVSNETVFDLVPAGGSTLPPAISGMEVFIINDVDNATHSSDVAALSMLQSNFTVLQNWTGDPCRPKDYNWEWIGCSYPDTALPRINKLLLSGYQLSGNVPDFSSLDALEIVDLSNNSLTGSIPEFLASLPNLQTLDLSHNDFADLPPSLRDNSRITLITIGNPKLLASSTSPGPSQATPKSSQAGACNQVPSSKFVLFVLVLAMAAVM